jgi:hypothetical protein
MPDGQSEYYRNLAGLPDPTDIRADIQSQTEQNLAQLGQIQTDVASELEFQRGQYDDIRTQIDANVAAAQQTLGAFESEVLASLEQGGVDAEALIAPYREQLGREVTNIRNAYGAQLRSQAVQIDSMMGAGEFGGNAYRAQQAYRTQMQDLTSQALGQVSNLVLQAESDILSTSAQIQQANLQNRNQQIQLLGEAAGMAVSAASTFTRDYLGLLEGQSGSVYNLMNLSANLSLQGAQIRQDALRLGTEAELTIAQSSAQVAAAYRQAQATEFAALQRRRGQEATADAAVLQQQIAAQSAFDVANIRAGANVNVANIQAQAESFGVEAWQDVMSGFSESGFNPNELFGGQTPLFISPEGGVTGL